MTRPKDMIQPIHIDDAQYLQLTRALRPKAEPVLKDVPAVMDGGSEPPPANPHPASPEQPPGAPIV